MDQILERLLNLFISLDGRILLLIQDNLRFEQITPIVKGITHLADHGIIWIVITLILLIPKKTRRVGIVSLLAMAGAYCITNLFLKNYVARVRPYEVIDGLNLLVAKADDWSFPSGHATASFASAVAIYKSRPNLLGVACVILAFLIALSRLYVGIHYPSDVICGAIIGTLMGLIMYWIFGEKKYKKR